MRGTNIPFVRERPTGIGIRRLGHPPKVPVVVREVRRVLERSDVSVLPRGELALGVDEVLDDGSNGVGPLSVTPTAFRVELLVSCMFSDVPKILNETDQISPEVLPDGIRHAEEQ